VNYSFAQDFYTQKVEEFPLKADQLVGVDKFDALYYIKENVLYKLNEERLVEFKDFQLGDIFFVDLLNTLQISIFYKEANTTVILDNRLNELNRVNFDRLENYKLVDFCTTANDQRLWIFNADTQELEIFNYQMQQSEISSLPFTEEVKQQRSNFNFCWVSTSNSIYQFNIYGSLTREIKIESTQLEIYKNRILIMNNKGVSYYFNHKNDQLTSIKLPEIEFNQVHLNDEKLYLYDGKMIHIYQITPK
jgi:hypothetical protein